MTEKRFIEIKKLYDKIEDKKRSIRRVDLLISSCGLGCKITGTPRNGTRLLDDYHFSDREQIIKLLMFEKETLQFQLSELEEVFSEQ